MRGEQQAVQHHMVGLLGAAEQGKRSCGGGTCGRKPSFLGIARLDSFLDSGLVG